MYTKHYSVRVIALIVIIAETLFNLAFLRKFIA